MSKRYGGRPNNNYKGNNNNNGGGGSNFVGGGGGGSGGGGSRFSSLKDFQTNDRERNRERQTTRRVSFKPSQLQMKGNLKGRMETAIRRLCLEDDEDMGDFATSSRYEERQNGPRRKGSPIPKGKFGFRKLTPNSFGWYQVTIQFGHRYSKDEVIRALLAAISPEFFIPHYWRIEKSGIVFFIDDFKIAERLQQVDRSIQMADGYRLFIRVRSGTPVVVVDEPFKEKVKLTMAKRYNVQTRALDLSKFHADPDFKDMFVALFRTPVMASVLDIIEKNIPDLVALNLNDNGIHSMEAFKNAEQRLPNLKVLYLDDNKIPSLAHLLVLRNVPILELKLKNNPLRTRYSTNSLYVSEVRRKFPKLVKLDGAELEPQILFDVNETSSLPQAKASFLVDPAGAEIIRQFLEQYFLILDSDNRQPLLDAYHEQAMMSISIPPASQAGRLENFWKYNRNFRRIMNNEDANKIRQLKVGRLAIVSTLDEWPKTQHDPHTFTVDLTLFTPHMMFLRVTGLFKEYDAPSSSKGGDIRSFTRQYVIVPAGGGFCIRNEVIHITSATNAEAATFMKSQGAFGSSNTPATSMNAGSVQSRLQHDPNQASTSTAVQIALPTQMPTQPDDATKMQMVQAMSAQSNMNVDWSRKCLEETNWDYNHAAYVFDKLHKENKIPPEAFIK